MRLCCAPAAPEATRKNGRVPVASGGRIELPKFVRPSWLAASRSPHPSPLPQGEGTAHPVLRRVEALWIGENAADDSPSPRESAAVEATLETPTRLPAYAGR